MITEGAYKRKKAWGLATSIDVHGCDQKLITCPREIKKYVVELCKLIGMERHGKCRIECFGDGSLHGHSFMQFIKTSSIVGHFDDKMGNRAFIDIFSCKYFDEKKACEFTKKFFRASRLTAVTRLRL